MWLFSMGYLWVPEQRLISLPKRIRGCFSEHADYLFNDLRENRLEVVLIPASEPKFSGHKIRAVENRNPVWYRKLYAQYSHFRRDRSLRSLERLKSLLDRDYTGNRRGFIQTPYSYDFVYRTLIQERLIEGFVSIEGKNSPNDYVREYFGLEILNVTQDDVPF